MYEHLHLALKSFKTEKDQENFIHDYSTGNATPEPPQFVNYSSAEGVPLTSSASKVTSQLAQFACSTQHLSQLPFAPPQSKDKQPFVNMAGIVAGNRASGPTYPMPVCVTSL